MPNNRQAKTFFLLLLFIAFAGFLIFSAFGTAHADNNFGAELPPEGVPLVKTLTNGLVALPLLAVLGLVKLFFQAAATLFAWIVLPANQTAILGQPVIYATWVIVRDILNVAFILALLFSAFATIFQVEKYSYKKLLLNLVLMALLVNFSFPIARFIIDTSNVLMYSLINRMGPNVVGANAIGSIAFGSNLAKIFEPTNTDITYLITSIVFAFLLAITLMAIAVMFVIRMVALAILVIFSPIAFVASIIPDTSSHSKTWWTSLFKYSFFGPVMIFMLYISSTLITQIGSVATMQGFQTLAVNQTAATSDPGLVATIAFYSIPIVILWFGMGMAQSMGGKAAGAVWSAAEKVSKGAGKKFSGYNAVKRQSDAYTSKRDERQKEKNKTNLGGRLGDRANDISDRARSIFPYGDKAKKRMEKRHKDKNKDNIDKGAKDLVDSGETTDSLAATINNDFKNPSEDKIETAKHATAYLRQDSDERKMHIQSTLERAGGIKDSDLEHIVNESGKGLTGVARTTWEAERGRVEEAAKKIATARKNNEKIEENDVRVVSAFVNKQMKRKVEAGANAESSPSKTVSYFKSKFSRSATTKPPAEPTKSAETPEERAKKEEREDTRFNR